ncbi:cobalt-precorrin-6A reductase [Nocardia sp. NPDC051787]|uniref:cobalt-precorrin-6A reductase n=1 Tax=Nocardia sp. NPDC051787 TaxID=3155415 RepID=UPI0034302E14
MRILILGGTREARDLARIASGERGFEIVSSLAGRVRAPLLPEGAVRVGGFGGAEGLRAWVADNDVAAVVDATHPFAAAISANAAAAARDSGVPLVRLWRPNWPQRPGDQWVRVPDLVAAAEAAATLGERVFLTIGRQGVDTFAGQERQWFLIRAIDPPAGPLPPRHEIILARGPFALADESRLIAEYGIDVLVTKDSGGDQTEAKLAAAREAGIPVVVIDRPPLPEGVEAVETVAQVIDWLSEKRIDRGG